MYISVYDPVSEHVGISPSSAAALSLRHTREGGDEDLYQAQTLAHLENRLRQLSKI
jgi:hypothetical protein